MTRFFSSNLINNDDDDDVLIVDEQTIISISYRTEMRDPDGLTGQ